MPAVIVRVISFILPLFAIIVLLRITRSMFNGKSQTEIWGYIQTDDKVLRITHWENLIGRTRSADIHLSNPKVSRVHAILVRSAKGKWRIFDIFSKGGVRVNGDPVGAAGSVLADGDIINLSEVSVRFREINERQRSEIEARRVVTWKNVHPAITLLFLSIFQFLLLLEHCFSA